MKIDPEALGRRFGDVRMGWLLGGWLVATAGIAYNRGVSLLWGMTWLLAAALVVAWILPRVQVRRIGVRRSVPPLATVGEPVEIRYELEGGVLPRYGIELVDRLGETQEPVLAAFVERTRGRDVLRLRWTPRVRGRRVFDDVVLRSRFPLGVASRSRIVAAGRHETLVHPAAVALRRLPIEQGGDAQLENLAARERRGHDEYAGARPYRPGDEPRTVHWRSTARSGELIVREYDRAAERQFWIFLELALGEHRGTGAEGTFETMFTIARSALEHAQADGLACGIVYREHGNIVRMEPSRDRAALVRMRDALALAEGDSGAPLGVWMPRERNRLPRGGTWLLFAGDDAQRGALVACCRAAGAVPLVVQFARGSFARGGEAAPIVCGAHFREGAWIAHAQRGMDLAELF